MPSGLPWSDPDSDPLADLAAAYWQGLQPLSKGERQRQAVWEWSYRHWLLCSGGLTYSSGLETPEWIQCNRCHERLVIVGSRPIKAQIRGAHYTKVIVDEIARSDRFSLSTETHHDALIALCLEHPWLTNGGGSAAATPSTRSATSAGSSAPSPAGS